MTTPVLLALLLTVASPIADLRSPDGRNVLSVRLDGEGALSYRVARDGRVVLGESPMGLRCEDADFSRGLAVVSVGPERERRESYRLVSGPVTEVDQPHRSRTVVLRNAAGERMAIDLDAGNEGVAFRYRLPGARGETLAVTEERTGFRVPASSRAWLQPYAPATSVSPAYEDYYYTVRPGDPPPRSRHGDARGWTFPALFHVPSAGAWVLISESGTGANYCGCHLGPDSTGGLYTIRFAEADERTGGVTHTASPYPTHPLPWTMPWRVIVLADNPGSIVMSTPITDLAPACAIGDTSWIRPGRASWSWWAYPDGPNAERYPEFLEMAHRYGWEYSLLDAGWWDTDVAEVSRQAARDGVWILMWTAANDFYDAESRRRKLDELRAAGASGVKVDFWCSDRQETMAAVEACLRDAATRRLTVNLHGCTLPRGWQRTYPNLLTCEAVLGAESYMFDQDFPERAAELNTILPFTRNVAGPMDGTPVALTMKAHRRLTTAAHELATAIVFSSGLIHYADAPEAYAALPREAQAVLREAPARWDETRFLAGEPGSHVVLARRAGSEWFVAGLNGEDRARELSLDLDALGGAGHGVLVDEGADAVTEVRARHLAVGARWEHTMPPRGGFVLRLVAGGGGS